MCLEAYRYWSRGTATHEWHYHTFPEDPDGRENRQAVYMRHTSAYVDIKTPGGRFGGD